MSTKTKASIEDAQMDKFFRPFEISTDWNELQFSKNLGLKKLPEIAAGFIEYQFLSYYFADPPKWRLLARRLRKEARIAPDYIMTGPAKSGSSDLVSHLLLHPNVMHPLSKEIRVHRNKHWRDFYPTEKEKLRLEQEMGQPVMCGCLEPYLNNMSGMKKLYEANPNAKVVITLRDPVDRAYSYWKWEHFQGGEVIKNHPYFKEYENYVARAIDLFPSIRMESFCGSPVLETGIYYKAVQHWITTFGKENVLVLDVADYFKARQPTLTRIQEFLGLPLVEIPEYGKKANENPIKLPRPTEEAKHMLAKFYKPFNQQLFDIIETNFDWQ
ncbi:hypothetical protein BB427_16165 [Pseudoalteromonas sp. BMB]|uniref:sulfotransferase domain-containing protein n=1 Tax=Pseudoalteromonas sp. BMB TaxID=1874619 RepID=UPI00083CA5E4|nr:sulfotransferase domain-containing protein [Pseudoalteromonas sp. BMB]ODB36263.1 hypothetical protein BB427_16165 [Pseudoalteromonas sp. BMB]